MPLLSNYCRKNSPHSRGDSGGENNCCRNRNNSESDLTVSCTPNRSSDAKPKCKYDGMGLMKTFLGPSLEDAVLKTLELGKSLMEHSEDNESVCNDKCLQKQTKKPCKERGKDHAEKYLEHTLKTHHCGTKNHSEDKQGGRQRITFTAQLDKNLPLVPKTPRKLSQVSKIRSLDSDLKTSPHSPEKIKKQLEALIQINKDEPPEHVPNWNFLTKIPPGSMDLTVMPSVCIYKKEAELNSSSCDAQSLGRSSCEHSSSNRCERRHRTRLGTPNGIRQAPEFISNALGPTLDVSIIDNLKMMRDIFKTGESGRGEGGAVCTGASKRSSGVSFVDSGTSKHESTRQRSTTPPPCSKPSQSQESLTCRIQEAERIIHELQERQCALQREIEEEEQERECRRMAFEEEEKKMCEMKACLENMAWEMSTRECGTQRSQPDLNHDCKYEAIKQRIACEEEKLSRLKDQYECYRREIFVAKSRCEAIRRNKCILDAWDIIASRACHTRLPSFSRAYALERKELNTKVSSPNMHCCFPTPLPASDGGMDASKSTCPKKCKSQNQFGSQSSLSLAKSRDNMECELSGKAYLMAQGEVPFPIQRDVTCGLHQTLKNCSCKPMMKGDAVVCNSDDELLKKCACAKEEIKPCGHSKSDTTVRRDTHSKIVKVMWAVTRINIFQDNCRTYEVMDATTTPPLHMPVKTEGIFVVKNSQRRNDPEPTATHRRKCTINFSKK